MCVKVEPNLNEPILTFVASLLLKVGCHASYTVLISSRVSILSRVYLLGVLTFPNLPPEVTRQQRKPAVTPPRSLFVFGSSCHWLVLVTFSCPYLLHVEPHAQYLKMKFCSFGSRYAGTGSQLEKTQSLLFMMGASLLLTLSRLRQMMAGCFLLACFKRKVLKDG